MVSAFPAEIQQSVAAQLADCLVGAVAQRLRYRSDLNLPLPECEILMPTIPVKNFIRNREFFRIQSVMETGADHGMWTFQRYQQWMEKRADWYVPPAQSEWTEPEPAGAAAAPVSNPAPAAAERPKPAIPAAPAPGQPIEIEPVEGGLEELIRKLGR